MQPNSPQRPTPGAPRPQFFDVVRPGRTPASPNSRPMLSSNRPSVQDSSMKKSAPAVPAGLAHPAPKPVAPPPPASVRPQPIPRPQPISVLPPAQQDMGKAAVDSLVEPEPIFQPQETSDPHADHPTHKSHSVWSEVIAVLAIILLVGIIINILLDAEILDLPIPHTNFFDY